MKAFSPELRAVAERVMWFETAEDALLSTERFLAYLMTHGTLEELLIARKYFSSEEFDRTLRNAPPGIFDPRSWNYWNLVYKHVPVPPLPKRVIP
ncbi:MAG TPA: hypothetical protein VMF66_07770 [Candidatus Acidoferrum sp.]|nr:hypothetical protein [Candidatus Acidoferrum sp.]